MCSASRRLASIAWITAWLTAFRAPGRLIVLDVTEPDRALLSFLRSLDRSPLRVQQTGTAGESYAFAWASGYKDGPTVRIQGVLQDA